MTAEDKSIEFLKRNSVVYTIPFFQRGYVWDKDNWNQLYDSLMSDDEANFLGAIILKNGEYVNDIMYKSVIDGQQRLTTISILARAINDEYYHPGGDQIIPTMESIIYNVDDVEQDDGNIVHKRAIKIRHSRKDSEDFENIIDGKYKDDDLDQIIDSDATSNLVKCYAYFRLKIRESLGNGERAKISSNLIKKMTIENRKSLVIITLSDSDNEQVIFDTINSAGVKLSSADIIKNAIFNQYVVALNSPKNSMKTAGNFYDDTWDDVFDKDDSTSDLWNEKRTIGKSNPRTRIELFLQAYAIIKRIFDPNDKNHKLEKLPDLFKTFMKNMSKEEVEAFIKELCDYASTYKDYFIDRAFEIEKYGCSFYDNNLSEKENTINQTLQILGFLNTATFECFVLKTIKECDEQTAVEKLKLLNNYLIRNYIHIGKVDDNYNKEAAKLTLGAETIEHFLIMNNLNNTTVVNDLSTRVANNPAKLLLFWIELFRNHENDGDKQSQRLLCNYQLEHVLPQKWEEHWNITPPEKDDNGNQLSEEQKIETLNQLKNKRALSVNTIGNMTLLVGTKNDQLSNYSFEVKLAGFQPKKGAFISGLKSSSSLLITKDITSNVEWNEELIEKRTSVLCDDFLQIWPLDDKLFSANT